MSNGQWDDWCRTVYVNRSSSTMVSSFCGHNKQTSVQKDVLLPPSCTWGEERMLIRTSAPRGGGKLQSRGQTALPSARSQHGSLWCTCQTSGSAGTFFPLPRLSPTQDQGWLSQVHLPAHLAWHTSMGCYLQHLLYRMRLIETERRSWARKPNPSSTHCNTAQV